MILSKKARPSQFADSWRMDDKEAEEIKKELKKSWKSSPINYILKE